MSRAACLAALVLLAETGGLRPPLASAAERVVYLTAGLTEGEFVAASAAVAALDPDAVLLPDTRVGREPVRRFLADYKPDRVVPVGTPDTDAAGLKARYGVTAEPAVSLAGLSERLPNGEKVVVTTADPPGLLLQAAALAGTLRVPLAVVAGPADTAGLEALVAARKPGRLYLCGPAAAAAAKAAAPGVARTTLADPAAVAARRRTALLARGPVRSLVLANPLDGSPGKGSGVSAVAPWLAVRRRAELVLTNAAGSDAVAIVKAALADPQLPRLDELLIAAAPEAVPPETRPNPLPGKDAVIEMEPGTPAGEEPFTLSTGRVFHADRAVTLLMLERPKLLPANPAERHALIASNPGGSLPLLETFSRHTAKELANGGYATVAKFEAQCTPQDLRKALPDQDVFLWEGHHRTLVTDYGLPYWPEPLRPSFVFLQSCLALNEPETAPLLERGAFAVVGSSTRIYSGTGGSFTLAFFDATVYDRQSLGGALRQAKNYLTCYTRLKEKRLGDEAKLKGANVRSAWAFSLWGDPAVRLPAPPAAASARAAVAAAVKGRTVTLTIPPAMYDRVERPPFVGRMWPNARLAGLLTRELDERRLVPFVFAEVALKPPADGAEPKLTSKLPASQWVFAWDARRKHGYVLAMPGRKERTEIAFKVEWAEAAVPAKAAAAGG